VNIMKKVLWLAYALHKGGAATGALKAHKKWRETTKLNIEKTY